MQRGTIATGSIKKRQVRFPGLINHAAALDVHRNHLYLVLSGKRTSKTLMKRYHELQKREQFSKEKETK